MAQIEVDGSDKGITVPISGQAVGFNISRAVRDLPEETDPDWQIESERAAKAAAKRAKQEYNIKNPFNTKIIKKIVPGAGAGDKPFVDGALAPVSNAPVVIPTPIATFEGLSSQDNVTVFGSTFNPPDTVGAVGPNHYVQMTNTLVRVFNKNGTPATAPFLLSSLGPATGPCANSDDGDPIVNYDKMADRWILSQFCVGPVPGHQVFAVSQTSDPTGAYFVYDFVHPTTDFQDYPKVAVWPDGYYMSTNQFNQAGTIFLGAGAFAYDRVKMLAGDPTASYIYFNQFTSICPSCSGQLPTEIDGTTAPPAGMGNLFMEQRADEFGDPADGLRIFEFKPNFTTPALSTFTQVGAGDLPLASFDPRSPGGRSDIEQPGIASGLDSISDRLMHRLAYRNLGTAASPVNSWVGNFTVNVSGVNPTSAATFQTGIRYFELRRNQGTGVMSVFEQGTHAIMPGNGAGGTNVWMGSIAQDNQGNTALGYSTSGSGASDFPSIRYAGRLATDPPGSLAQGQADLILGTGFQNGGGNRWGDYSAMTVDPTDDCTFWYTQEYRTAAQNANAFFWQTRIGSFKYPTCVAAQKGTISGTITSCASGAPLSAATVGATGGFSRFTGAPGTYSMMVPPGTYTVTASKSTFGTASQTGVVVTNGGTATVNLCLTGVPVLAAGTATIVSESCMPANGVVDPGETVTMAFPVTNIGGANTVNDIGTLAATGGVSGPSGPQNYGVVFAGGGAVSRNFTFNASPSLVCGTNITATVQHQDGATNLGNLVYTIPTGVVGGSPTITSYTGPPVPVPDNVPAGANIVLPVSGITGGIADLNFRLDALAGCDAVIGNTNASMDHTFNGDLTFRLISPAGTSVNLITNRGGGGNNFCTVTLDDDGGFPAASTMATAGAITGNFAPESALSAFDGQNPNGNWTLNVADTAGVDTGSLRRFSLLITPRICCVGAASISGTITYGNAIGTPTPPRFVKNVSLSSTAGSPPVGPVITGTPGTYTLSGFGAGSYTIKPTKAGGPNAAISSTDAARVSQGVAASPAFVSQNQRFAADVTGNGQVSSQDAGKIAQFVAGLPLAPPNLTAEWRFFVTGAPSPLPTPPQTYNDSRSYASVTSSLTGQDFVGILLGEVSGNWNPATHPRPAAGPERSTAVELPQMTASTGKDIVIPVNVQGVANKDIIAYEFNLRYDPAVIQPMQNPVDVTGTISRGLSVVTNPYEPGLLRVVLYGVYPIDADGLLLNLRFTAVGAVGSVSPLSFERIMFKEGEPLVVVSDGLLEISN